MFLISIFFLIKKGSFNLRWRLLVIFYIFGFTSFSRFSICKLGRPCQGCVKRDLGTTCSDIRKKTKLNNDTPTSTASTADESKI